MKTTGGSEAVRIEPRIHTGVTPDLAPPRRIRVLLLVCALTALVVFPMRTVPALAVPGIPSDGIAQGG